jgi:hypothetical protein
MAMDVFRALGPTWTGVALVAALLGGACQAKSPPPRGSVPPAISSAPKPAAAPPAAAAPAAQVAPAAPVAAGAPTKGDPCARICDRTVSLGCKRAATCAESCRQMRDHAACAREMAAVLNCFAREPVAHWSCNEEGEAAIKDGFCDAEQGQFAGCIQKSGAEPARRL